MDMKKTNIFTIGLALVAGLSSCEMADEMRGNDSDAGMGALDLAVSVAETVSRADASPSTDNFEVVITDTENAENTYTYVYSELTAPVSLPVGTYTVAAHTPGEIATQMTEPYYGGSEPLTITQGVTSEVNVVCKMENTKITMSYSDDFKSTFRDWNITLNNGADKTLTFTNEDMTDDAIYWYVGEGVATMMMDVRATTTTGEQITDQKKFTKADADQSHDDDNPNFAGGDFLNINIDIDENEPSGDNRPQISFDINVDLTFGNSDVTVEIPVEDVTEPEDPDQPGDENNIVISDNGTGYLTNGVTVEGGNYPDDVAVVMNVPDSIKSVYVKIITTNNTFRGMVTDMGLVDGDGMDLASESASGLATLFELPSVGATEYTFTMSDTLFGLLGNFAGKHDFTLTVIDANNNQKSATLTINI